MPAVRVFCKRFHVPDDVAGATILGAALNAPELFTAVVATLVQKNNVGVGVVMGSWNFNILLISGFSALVARQKLRSRQLKVNWIFLQRDVYFYFLAVLLIVVFCRDSVLTWPECALMVATYIAYVLVCLYTGRITRHWCPNAVHKPRRRREVVIRVEQSGGLDLGPLDPRAGLTEGEVLQSLRDLSPPRGIADNLLSRSQEIRHIMGLELPPEAEAEAEAEDEVGATTPLLVSYNPQVSSRLGLSSSGASVFGLSLSLRGVFTDPISEIEHKERLSKEERKRLIHLARHPDHPNEVAIDWRLVDCALDEEDVIEPYARDALVIAEEIELSEGEEEYHAEHLLAWPDQGDFWSKFLYVVNFPFNAVVHFTVPWSERIYPLTGALAIIWLALISYVLSDLSKKFGDALLIPDKIVGLTLDAVGTSMPNLLAAVMASKKGKVETAVCQAFGSNTFDALVAFGLVQFIRCGMNGFRPVYVKADGVDEDGVVDIVILFLYLWFLYFFRMRLTRGFGGFCIVVYFAWLASQFYKIYH